MVEQFVDESAAPLPLPGPFSLALDAARGERRQALHVVYRVRTADPARGLDDESPHVATACLASLLKARKLPFATPYVTLNGLPLLLGGPPLPVADPDSPLADVGLWLTWPNDQRHETRVGWWGWSSSGDIDFAFDVTLLKGRILKAEGTVLEVTAMESLGRFDEDGEIELVFNLAADETMLVLARHAETGEIVNALWLTPEERVLFHHEGYPDEVRTEDMWLWRRQAGEKR